MPENAKGDRMGNPLTCRDCAEREALVAEAREALTLVQAVAYDDKGDYLNRVRLVVDTALGPRRNAFENAPSGNPAPDGFEVERLREALRQARACMEWCVNLGADDATAQSLRRGIEVIDRFIMGDEGKPRA